ncbi:MAG: hypothetical protein ABSF61_06530 [Anaerolineales bacterium]|jgi:hypothetical protein
MLKALFGSAGESPLSIRRNLASEYIRAEIAHWGSYHNHKEQMAWGATALFLTGATALSLVQLPRFSISPFLWWLFPLAVIVTVVAAIRFVWWQLDLREVAANRQRATGILAIRWLVTPPSDADLKVEPDPCSGRPTFPALKCALSEVEQGYRHRGSEDPRIAKRLTIIVMVIWGLAALVHVLYAGFSCAGFRSFP